MLAIHVFECPNCNHRKEEMVTSTNPIPCPNCKGMMRVVFDWGTSGIETFKPFVDEFMDKHPVKITSKRQWATECKKRGLKNAYLESGYSKY